MVKAERGEGGVEGGGGAIHTQQSQNRTETQNKMAFNHTALEGQRSLIFPLFCSPFSFLALFHLFCETPGWGFHEKGNKKKILKNHTKDVYTCPRSSVATVTLKK